MISIDSGALFLIVLVLCATGLGLTWMLTRADGSDDD